MFTRIAPTPSGFLHLGNAFSFLLTQQFARAHQGRILLRIDDGDADRKRPEYIADIFESLHWLGIEWHAGPQNPDDFERHWSQRHRVARYSALLEELIARGAVFACSCSRRQLQGHPIYPGTCAHRALPLDAPDTCLRIAVPPDAVVRFHDDRLGPQEIPIGAALGSFVIRRRDGIHAYQLSSLADDLQFGIDCIVRGADLLHSTAAQCYLANLLGERAAPFLAARFCHHPLLPDDRGGKLSKSAGSLSLRALRDSGTTRADIVARLSPLLAAR